MGDMVPVLGIVLLLNAAALVALALGLRRSGDTDKRRAATAAGGVATAAIAVSILLLLFSLLS